jgi:hypothetical protein
MFGEMNLNRITSVLMKIVMSSKTPISTPIYLTYGSYGLTLARNFYFLE